jgi:DNA-binding transcriptional LysR family regulator
VAETKIKLSAIDLNLLVVFDAVMQDRSVTRAGGRLSLSQSAMSHALARLRHMLKDELFIRSPKGMVPTPRAEQLALPVRRALDGLQHSLEPAQFDPSSAKLTLRISVANYAAITLVGPLASRMAKAAPGVTPDFRPSGRLNILDLLDSGEIDLAIGHVADQSERISSQTLLKDEFVAVMRRDHPAAMVRRVTIKMFAALSHLDISSVTYSTDFVDQALQTKKLARRIALRAPLLSAGEILATSNMVSVFPRRMAEVLVRLRPLITRPLGFSAPKVVCVMIWPRRLHDQAAHRWLRQTVVKLCESLRSSQTAR